ncbi:uncharacterized protein [Physcomitrium patens]|uniref:DUF2062 domain-containing protein n=1 Tax=Physcomitrium patens TaxID=3218 RepID=A9SCG1_PHYPA|nr:uncharacterized protein LOC112294144 [Physcomitrium patens]PNR36495.1 hypothetical protein PHYPA_022346 [Physcomitrium patens]|eukprot:XP_024400113.1 uncharacterized protein LOC112294144 [Physcomitrella patens]
MERERSNWQSYRVVRWARTKVYKPVMVILRRGVEPKQLALSAALGMTLGVFPICGVTVIFCGIAVALLAKRCNGPTMMLANFLATPLQMSLMVPFLRVGERMVGASPFALSKNALWQALTGKASGELVTAIGHALLGWLVSSPFLFVVLYAWLLPFTRWAQKRLGNRDQLPNRAHVAID